MIDKQMPAVLWSVAAATCALAWETALGCVPLAALLAYTGANALNNNRRGEGNLVAGWNWKDPAMSLPASLISGGTVLAGGLGFAGGFMTDIATQELDHRGTVPNFGHAVCSGVGGAEAAMTQFGGGAAAKAVKDFAYGVVTGMEPTVICGGP